MSLSRKDKIFATSLVVGTCAWVALMAYSRWSVYLAPQSFDALAMNIWLTWSAIGATFILFALIHGRRIGKAGIVKSALIVILGVFTFGMSFMLVTYGVAALGAKLSLGQPTSQCYGVVHFSASRGVRLHLRDLDSGYVYKLKFPRYLADATIAKGPAGEYARVIGKQSWFGTDVDRIEGDATCGPNYSPKSSIKIFASPET